MKLARVLVPVAFTWVALTGCGDAPEARRTSRTPKVARARARHGTREATPREGDPILESIRLLAARKKGGAGARPGEGPSLAEMLPPLRSASAPYDIAEDLERRFVTPARRVAAGPDAVRLSSRAPVEPDAAARAAGKIAAAPKETPAEKVAAAPRETPARAKEKPATLKEKPRTPKETPAAPDGSPVRRPEGPKPPPAEEAGKAFKLAPGDELELKVSGQPEFSGGVRVREDGTVALPSTGDPVQAKGKTVEEFARAVAGAISPRYVKRRPAVSVKLLRSMRSREGRTP